MKMRKIAIIGAGNGGQSAAFELARKGFAIHLCDIDENVVQGIREVGGIHAFGKMEGFAQVSLLTTNVKEAVEEAEAILPMVPRYAHRSIAEMQIDINDEDPSSSAPDLLHGDSQVVEKA